MGNQQRQGAFENLTDMLGDLFTVVHPAWSIPSAAAAYYLLAHVLPPDSELSRTTFRPVWNFLGGMTALCCLAGGVIGWFARTKKAAFLKEELDLEWVKRLSWQEFEEQMASVYRNQGYQVDVRGGSSPDGGIDLRLEKEGQTSIVQCKHWKQSKVGVKVVRELLGVVTAARADEGIFVTSGDYTRDARRFGEDNGIQLVGRREFLDLVRQFQRDQRLASGISVETPAKQPGETNPVCPSCGGSMERRTAKSGPFQGQDFWGCRRWPDCKGTVHIG